jgi:hypothetical protein
MGARDLTTRPHSGLIHYSCFTHDVVRATKLRIILSTITFYYKRRRPINPRRSRAQRIRDWLEGCVSHFR